MFWRKKTLTPERLLIKALAERDLPEALRLLDAGADANGRDPDGVPALALAVEGRWLEGTQALLERGADPNTSVHSPKRQLHHRPVLQLAAIQGTTGVLRSLLAAGARLDDVDGTGLTALMSASYAGHAEVVSILIAQGAALDQRDDDGYTALMFAANTGRAAVIRKLLAAGADPSARDSQGSTPIMFAAQHGHDTAVELLLEAGADPAVEGNHGLSAIGFARQNRHASTLALLTSERSVRPAALSDPAATAGELRERALNVSPADLALAPTTERPRVWGVLMEMGDDNGVATLVAFADGAASLYFSGGGGVIGAGEHRPVRAAIGPLLDAAESLVGALAPASATPLPDVGRVRFYVRTFHGTLTADADQGEIERDRHALRPLYAAGHDVITAIRKVRLLE